MLQCSNDEFDFLVVALDSGVQAREVQATVTRYEFAVTLVVVVVVMVGAVVAAAAVVVVVVSRE